jgi:hypothetical protein
MSASACSRILGLLTLVGILVAPAPVVAVIAALGLLLGLAGLIRDPRPLRRVALTGILSSIAGLAVALATLMPSRGTGGNEAGTLFDIRTVIEAQAAYSRSNGGRFDTLDCLAGPRACLPGYAETAPYFLDSRLASGEPKSGYKRTFLAGPAATGLSASSMSSFAYVAVPTAPGTTGGRGFCGDWEGTICVTPKGDMPQVKDGRCVTTVQDPNAVCIPLR